MISIYTDGGARGNPGPAAIGFFIKDENGQEVFSHGEKIGVATNNVAEYRAVISALSWVCQNKEKVKDSKVNFFLDSNLVCSQINGVFKIKNSNLRTLLYEVREKEAELKFTINYSFIPRERNEDADRLVNMALDNKI
ncbi:MAG: ribonuclease HI family protein [bacterium]|nr:ribonuclease HI family protein [bacterium]